MAVTKKPVEKNTKKSFESDKCNESVIEFMEAMENKDIPEERKVSLFADVIDNKCLPPEVLEIAKKEKKRIMDSLLNG